MSEKKIIKSRKINVEAMILIRKKLNWLKKLKLKLINNTDKNYKIV